MSPLVATLRKAARVVVGFCGGFEDLDVPAAAGQEHGYSRSGNTATDDKCAWHDNSFYDLLNPVQRLSAIESLDIRENITWK